MQVQRQGAGRALVPLVLLAFLLAVTSLPASSPESLRGRVELPAERPAGELDRIPFVTENGKTYEVWGDSFTNAQLLDPRLSGRLWELQGVFQPDGGFKIQKPFTLKDGNLYLVTYYCEICNIQTHAPGRCMCCQGETELQELPAH